MSRFPARKGKRLPGSEFTWDNEPGGEADTAPTPLFPVRCFEALLAMVYWKYVVHVLTALSLRNTPSLMRDCSVLANRSKSTSTENSGNDIMKARITRC